MRAFGWRGGEPPRASILSVYASKSSLPGDCRVAALLAMTVAVIVFAWFIIRARSSSFLMQGISRLTLEMTTCPIRGEAVGRAGRPRPAA